MVGNLQTSAASLGMRFHLESVQAGLARAPARLSSRQTSIKEYVYGVKVRDSPLLAVKPAPPAA